MSNSCEEAAGAWLVDTVCVYGSGAPLAVGLVRGHQEDEGEEGGKGPLGVLLLHKSGKYNLFLFYSQKISFSFTLTLKQLLYKITS